MYTHQKTHKVILVDDDPEFGKLVSRWLEAEGFETETFYDGESFLQSLSRLMPYCVCLDLTLPKSHGREILAKLKQNHKDIPVLILTADSSAEEAVNALQSGAHDYLVKPIDKSKLIERVKNAVEHFDMAFRISQFEREKRGDTYGMVGASNLMQKLFSEIDRVARSDISVVIRGESGTGKELVAKAIHSNSGRANGKLVAINCGAIPESLQESELFGHEKGSFTGADKRRLGRFEEANEGTLFLDEVAELSLPVQAKLLRVLQEKTFSRLGSSNEIKSDFRIIAASHEDLIEEVAAGRFREDLFYRIAVYELEVPSLRERGDDVILMAKTFLDHFSRRHGRKMTLSPETLVLLKNYKFPGNVRELQNYMQRAVVACTSSEVAPDDLPRRLQRCVEVQSNNQGQIEIPSSESAKADKSPASITSGESKANEEFDYEVPQKAIDPTASVSYTNNEAAAPNNEDSKSVTNFQNKTLKEIEKIAITEAIKRNDGNISSAGQDLGIGRTTLYRKIKEYDISI